jgi:hypothetical protein
MRKGISRTIGFLAAVAVSVSSCATLSQSDALARAKTFMGHQADAAEVNLDSIDVRSDSIEWQVYFFRRQLRIPRFALVAVNKRTKEPRRVPLR